MGRVSKKAGSAQGQERYEIEFEGSVFDDGQASRRGGGHPSSVVDSASCASSVSLPVPVNKSIAFKNLQRVHGRCSSLQTNVAARRPDGLSLESEVWLLLECFSTYLPFFCARLAGKKTHQRLRLLLTQDIFIRKDIASVDIYVIPYQYDPMLNVASMVFREMLVFNKPTPGTENARQHAEELKRSESTSSRVPAVEQSSVGTISRDRFPGVGDMDHSTTCCVSEKEMKAARKKLNKRSKKMQDRLQPALDQVQPLLDAADEALGVLVPFFSTMITSLKDLQLSHPVYIMMHFCIFFFRKSNVFVDRRANVFVIESRLHA